MGAAKWGEFWMQEIWRSATWLESLWYCWFNGWLTSSKVEAVALLVRELSFSAKRDSLHCWKMGRMSFQWSEIRLIDEKWGEWFAWLLVEWMLWLVFWVWFRRWLFYWCSEFDFEGGCSSVRKPTSRGVTELSSSYTGWMLELHRVEVAIPLSYLSLFSMLHYMHGMIT
jgi:hypothetical protein